MIYNKITINHKVRFAATNIIMSIFYEKMLNLLSRFGYEKNKYIKNFIEELNQDHLNYGCIDVEISCYFNKSIDLKILIKLIQVAIKEFKNINEFYNILINDLINFLKYLKKYLKELESKECILDK